MSALPLKADISWCQSNARFVPIAHRTAATRSYLSLLFLVPQRL
jgi:hypothetical protein